MLCLVKVYSGSLNSIMRTADPCVTPEMAIKPGLTCRITRPKRSRKELFSCIRTCWKSSFLSLLADPLLPCEVCHCRMCMWGITFICNAMTPPQPHTCNWFFWNHQSSTFNVRAHEVLLGVLYGQFRWTVEWTEGLKIECNLHFI